MTKYCDLNSKWKEKKKRRKSPEKIEITLKILNESGDSIKVI